MWFIIFGGDMRDRTADLLNAIQALYLLSFTLSLRFPRSGPAFRSISHQFNKAWTATNPFGPSLDPNATKNLVTLKEAIAMAVELIVQGKVRTE